MRVFSLRDQTWRAAQMASAEGPAPLQSVEGLSLGADLTVRFAIDPLKVAGLAKSLPDNVAGEIVDPAVQGVAYKVFARYTVREIFSTKRAEIQAQVEAELKPRLAADGVLLRSVQIGKIDLPADYRKGMEELLAEELAGEKMKYTLDLKEKQVKETELKAQAEKVRREIGAEAAAREQVIAAKAQEEAMKHVLPFKQRQIEQRQLEAEAQKVSRIKAAEAEAQARRIEASGEAEARQKLADAEVYRLDKVGKSNAEQMGREGALLSRHPLLIQKTMADKLSDKVQVIIAAPGSDGGFIGAGLLGTSGQKRTALANDAEQHAAADAKESQ
jgi:regulator of protease activity HflC (stomatin/prohibitin superfamily)